MVHSHKNLNSITGRKININLIRQNLIKNNQIIRQVWIEDLYKNKMAICRILLGKKWISKKHELNYCKPIGKVYDKWRTWYI